MVNDLVSIIMLSRNNERFLEQSVRSVMAQTYKNWNLLVIDDSSNDDTIKQLMLLKEEDRKACLLYNSEEKDGYTQDRIKVSQNVFVKGQSLSRNSSLKDAKGRWIAFLDCGDLWAADKLQKQISFMEEHGCGMSYSHFNVIDEDGKLHWEVSGPEYIDYQEMLKCCWPGYLTVMIDTEKTGKKYLKTKLPDNYYSLWLQSLENTDCLLIDEVLATCRTPHATFSNLWLTSKFKWRYEVYRVIKNVNPFVATWYSIRNLWFAALKRKRYVRRVSK